MDRETIKALLDKVRDGQLSVDDCLSRLQWFPYEDIGFAKLDHHRGLRRGFPEVVFCEGKTVEQCVRIIERMSASGQLVLATRANRDVFEALGAQMEQADYNELARTIRIGEIPLPRTEKQIAVITAGTSDVPVAEEAAITAETMGCPVVRIFDVGVAGIHRLFEQKDKIAGASVIIVIAGMEGALASVIGGIVDCPVVAVPTSVGYGASFKGLAALLAMLNSCAPGVATMNIDNGFGAGYFAAITVLGKPST